MDRKFVSDFKVNLIDQGISEFRNCLLSLSQNGLEDSKNSGPLNLEDCIFITLELPDWLVWH